MRFYFSRVLGNLFKTPYLRKAFISTFLILTAFPLIFYFAIKPSINDMIMQNIEKNANITARHLSDLINPQKKEITKGLFVDPSTADIMDRFQHDRKLEKIKVFSKTGEIIFSSNPKDIGTINTKPYFHDLVSKGYPYSKIINKEQKTKEERTVTADVVETYVPVMHLNKFLGAFEIYYDITTEKASLDNMVRFYGLLWLGLTLSLMVALFFIFYQTSREVLRHQHAQEEKKRTNAKLRQEKATRMEALGSLAGGIAHDFNNILAIITGFTELALTRVEPSDPVVEDLQEVLSAGERARVLIQQILAFSRDNDQRNEPLLLKDFLSEVIKSLKSTCPPNATLRTHIESDSYVFAESSRLHQLILNLCTNGLQALEGKTGNVEVTLSDVEFDSEDLKQFPSLKPGAFVKLTVTDTGAGIKEEDMPQIFDPFFTTKARGMGNGMGLSVVHGIVKGLHGAIAAYSEYGVGSTFTVFLPKFIAEGLPKKTSEETTEPSQQNTEKILFVDDEVALVKIGQRLLEKIGYDVETVTSSTEALELFQSCPDKFDLVISDISMPNMTGDVLAKEILDIRPNLPIILCSGYAGTTKNDLHHKVDVKAIIDKPIMKNNLARTIRRVLDDSTPQKKSSEPPSVKT